MEEWESGGCKGDRPKPVAAGYADSRGYQKARVLATVPNLYPAIYKYQEEHPDERRMFDDELEWGDSVGSDNSYLKEITSTSSTIRESVLYKCIDDICEGSAKIAHLMEEARTLKGVTAKRRGLHGTEISYQSKLCIATNVRLVKAIIYAVRCAKSNCYKDTDSNVENV